MGFVLLSSIGLRVLAMLRAVSLAWKLREWRVGFFALVLAFMALRQALTWIARPAPMDLFSGGIATELPGLAVSLMAVLFVFLLERIIREQRSAAKRLGRSEDILQTLAKASPAGIFRTEINGSCTFVNERCTEIIGLRKEQALGFGWLQEVHPDDREQVDRAWRNAVDAGGSFHAEFRYLRADGSLCWVIGEASPTHADNGDITGYVGVLLDITGHKQAEEALHGQLVRNEQILQSMLDGYILADTRGKLIEVNPAYCKITGYSREELLSMNIVELEAQLTPEQVAEKIEQMVKHGGARFETRHRAKDGRAIDLEVSIIIMPSPDGPMVAAFVRDITETKKSREALVASEERLRAIVAHMPVMLDAFDENGLIVEWNEECERVTGYRAAEIVGNPEAMKMLYPDGAYLKRMQKKWQKIGNDYRNWEWEITCKDGSKRLIAWSNISERYSIPGWATWGVGVDVTERKRAEREIIRSQEQLRALAAHLQSVREEERAAIAREIHDELGQIQAVLKMDLSFIENELRAGDVEKKVETVLGEIAAMNRLIDQSVQKVANLITELRPEILDNLGLIPALEWQMQEFQKHTGLHCEFRTNVDHLDIDGQAAIAVFRILQEALTNISRHAHATSVLVDIQCNDDRLTLRVQDDGRGISEEKLQETQHFGLIGMHERSVIIGGELKIEPCSQGGTCVRLDLPWRRLQSKKSSRTKNGETEHADSKK